MNNQISKLVEPTAGCGLPLDQVKGTSIEALLLGTRASASAPEEDGGLAT